MMIILRGSVTQRGYQGHKPVIFHFRNRAGSVCLFETVGTRYYLRLLLCFRVAGFGLLILRSKRMAENKRWFVAWPGRVPLTWGFPRGIL